MAQTIDPTQIQSPSQIPPPGAQYVRLSSQGQVDVYCGTLVGDVDAQPAARELTSTALDTGGAANADYIYNQVSAVYGGAQLPAFQSPEGNNVKSLVFVSGSNQGGYGAFHIGDGSAQADFDRIVVDSLTVAGNYSAGSGLGAGAAMAPIATRIPRIFGAFKGPGDLLEIVHPDDPRLKAAEPSAIRLAHGFAVQSLLALQAALETRNVSTHPRGNTSHNLRGSTKEELVRHLIHANQEILGLVRAVAAATSGRQYLSTALFAAEIIESFQTLTHKANPGKTDGEAVSRVVAFKLAPEIALVPGFNSGVTQQWWQDGHPDYVTKNSQNDQSIDGNAAGVMFLLFLTDYLGIPVDQIMQAMPATDGAPLGETYTSLLQMLPPLASQAGKDGKGAFQKMISLLQQNAQTANGTLALPADGNPFSNMPGAKSGGLFSQAAPLTPSTLAQDAQAALGLEVQIEQQLTAVKSVLQQIQGDIPAKTSAAVIAKSRVAPDSVSANQKAAFSYGPPLPSSVVTALEQRVASFRASQYDQSLQQDFWRHVYNELPGSGTNTYRLQVITGTDQSPQAVQITGTITSTKQEGDGDLHIAFQPDNPGFPTNQSSAEPPLEIEIIYAGRVTQADAEQAQQGYTNPFDVSQLKAGVRIQAAGPLIFDRAHGRVDASGNVQYGLEIHPLVGMTVLTGSGTGTGTGTGAGAGAGTGSPPQTNGQLSSDLTSALGQIGTLSQSVANLSSLLQKMQVESQTPAPTGLATVKMSS